jgi:sporulation protein YlmC with PRC-barrel domain
MLRRTTELKSYAIQATDGEIGSVDQFYFDDLSWVIRYLVVTTGNWLTGRKVLISPIAVEKAAWENKKIHLSLTQEEIKNSPDIDMDPPVSRQREIEYYNYHGWPYYWEGGGIWGPWPYPRNLVDDRTRIETERRALKIAEVHDPHLRSTNEVTGYHIGAIDGEIGHLEDLLIDDETWAIQYLVVDTRNWWPGKKVLVGLQWIDKISWRDSKVYVNLTRETLKNGPEFDPSVPLTPEYESRLTGYYHQL